MSWGRGWALHCTDLDTGGGWTRVSQMNQAVIRQLRNLIRTGRLSSHQEKILCLKSQNIYLIKSNWCHRAPHVTGESERSPESESYVCRYRYHLQYHSDRPIIVILTQGGCGACDKSESRVMLVSEDISSRSGARLWRPDLCQWVTLWLVTIMAAWLPRLS